MLELRDKAPDFNLTDENGNKVSLEDMKGSWVVLYFYPRDNTPGCVTEALQFTAQMDAFTRLGVKVIGVSSDSCERHKQFIIKHDIKVRLLSDPGREVQDAYSDWGEDRRPGKLFRGLRRSTVIIDPEGRIVHYWPKVRPNGHAEEVRRTLAELQAELEKDQ